MGPEKKTQGKHTTHWDLLRFMGWKSRVVPFLPRRDLAQRP